MTGACGSETFPQVHYSRAHTSGSRFLRLDFFCRGEPHSAIFRAPVRRQDRRQGFVEQTVRRGQTKGTGDTQSQWARQDPVWSEAQRGQSPRRPDRTSEVRDQWALEDKCAVTHLVCWCGYAFLIHRGVSPRGRDAPGGVRSTQSFCSQDFPPWSWALCLSVSL